MTPNTWARRSASSPLYTAGIEFAESSAFALLGPRRGLSLDGARWVPCTPGFFLPVRVLSRLFLEYLQNAFDSGKLRSVSKVKWVVYAKRPFAGPEKVLDYVGPYTHRIAISNNRLSDIDGGQVSFRYKDYRNSDQQRTMTLAAEEFIRRFLLHVLPRGFHRIRYYGFLGNRSRQAKLARCRELLSITRPQVPPKQSANSDYHDRHEELTGTFIAHMSGLSP